MTTDIKICLKKNATQGIKKMKDYMNLLRTA